MLSNLNVEFQTKQKCDLVSFRNAVDSAVRYFRAQPHTATLSRRPRIGRTLHLKGRHSKVSSKRKCDQFRNLTHTICASIKMQFNCFPRSTDTTASLMSLMIRLTGYES